MTDISSLKFERNLVEYSKRMSDAQREARLAVCTFGTVFTEHMVTVRYTQQEGWHSARVDPFGPIPMSPATAALHYGQEIFEGLKLYRTDVGMQFFRPEANARRFRVSARRLAMAEVPDGVFIGALEELGSVDRTWLPETPGASLYLRPFLMASEEFIGVRPATQYLFGVIACPVGAAPVGGAAPLTVFISDQDTRAAAGGTGAAKCAGNYAASMPAYARAVAAGCDQVVFLDAARHEYVEELGGMNVFFVHDDGTLVTPELSGTILPGITRDSLIRLAEHQGHRVVERPYTVEEWRSNAASGRLREVFACGTAAVVAPIGAVRSNQGDFRIADGVAGPVTVRLRSTLTGIQFGQADDPFGWSRQLL